MKKINLNGQIISKDIPVFSAENRSFRYGDGLFETMRVIDGHFPFWDLHLKRLKKGAKFLKFKNIPKSTLLQKEILKLCGSKDVWRVRLSLFRKDGGFYTPKSKEVDFFIEAEKLDNKHFILNEKGLKIDICNTFSMPIHPIFKFKTSNSLPYVLAGIFKNKKKLDDCILLNDRKGIVEASSSNIFIIQKDKIFTPPLKSGCKDGVMRKAILKLAKAKVLSVELKELKAKDLYMAQEVWLSNATQGIRWVKRFQEFKYENAKAKNIIPLLNDLALK